MGGGGQGWGFTSVGGRKAPPLPGCPKGEGRPEGAGQGLLCWAAISGSLVGRSSSRVLPPSKAPDVPQGRATPLAETFPAPAAILVTDPAG